MNGLGDLYQELVLDHARNPRNRRAIEGCAGQDCSETHGANPLCGDKLTLFVKTDGELIEDIAFEGAGCAIFTSSSSLMTEALRGKPVSEAQQLVDRFTRLMTDENPPEYGQNEIGKLIALAGVREFPIRVKCATLPWRTLEVALTGARQTATTE